MIIFDNIIFSLQKAGGISVVWNELIKRLPQDIDMIILEYNDSNNNYIKDYNTKGLNVINRRKLFFSIYRYLPFFKIKNPFEKFIFHSSYYRFSLNPCAINITTVHDFTYEIFRSDLLRYFHIFQKWLALKFSDHIVCISKNTYKDLLRLYPSINKDKVSIIYNGVSEDYYFKGNALMYPNTLLFIGSRVSYKNFDFAVRLCAINNMDLIIVGGGDLTSPEKDLLDSLRNYKHYTFLSNIELNEIYNNVLCLLYMSDYEGFGIPVLEAQIAGCPVIAQNKSSIPEVISVSEMLISSLDLEEASNILNKLRDSNFRNYIVNKGICKSSLFSWSHMTESYVKLYNNLLNKK